jgi:acetylornithine deacetylase/succinyl-diaminopimelate desuccinylase-like protein
VEEATAVMMTIANEIVARISRQTVVELALELSNIESAVGHEAELGEHIYQWMKREGFACRKVGLLKDRFNVMGVLNGSGGGHSLLFNSHMDTHIPREPDWVHLDVRAHEYRKAWLDGEWVCGEGIVNDKGPMAAFLIAAKAIKDSGHRLKGDLVLTAVVAETSHEPVDDVPGAMLETKDLGTRFLATHGGIADYALIAEGTGFSPIWVEPGEYWYKITLRSDKPPFYTPYLPDRTTMAESPNMIVAAAAAIEALERWAAAYQKRNVFRSRGGTIVPKAQIGGIRGGDPSRPILAPQIAALYLDVRATPGQDPLRTGEEIKQVITDIGLSATVDIFSFRRGYEAQNIERLVDSVRRAHIATFGSEPTPTAAEVSSLWRDINIYNEIGIPALTYGPRTTNHAYRRALPIESLYQAACAYALIAVDLCNQDKE